ncbi:hypothetical protein [Tsukamurella paurometabola]|uniref:Uncharacterized protein n=1 Tax=Tsukamurella paurometabola TaxID=2061 RepID=A0ABS5NER8_TSUPA|nr:hypothetical protein [Tsukamurella paurometabola]MBS4102387.1 hypothetical protein [Tsukamurella paurometabola]
MNNASEQQANENGGTDLMCEHTEDYEAGCTQCRNDFRGAYMNRPDNEMCFQEHELTDEVVDRLIRGF